jgi:hypothetical protein
MNFNNSPVCTRKETDFFPGQILISSSNIEYVVEGIETQVFGYKVLITKRKSDNEYFRFHLNCFPEDLN